MAQERKGEYNVPLTSVTENKFRQGLFPAGRYRGFDTMTNAGGVGVNINIEHTGGFIRNNFSNPPAQEVNPYAYVITPQGVAMETDVSVTNLAVDPTVGGNGYRRVDLIVLEHEYTQVQGGASANVVLVKGTESDGVGVSTEYPNPPALTNPSKQTILGYLYIKETASFSYADLTYVPASVPNLANAPINHSDVMVKQSNFWGRESVTLTSFTGTPSINDLAPVVYVNQSTLQTINGFLLDKQGNEELKDGAEIEFLIMDKPIRLQLGAAFLPTNFNTQKQLNWTDGTSAPYDTSNGMYPTQILVTDSFKVRWSSTDDHFKVIDIRTFTGSQISDRDTGWYKNGNGITSLTAGAAMDSATLHHKTYHTYNTDHFGSAINVARMTTSFHLKANMTLDVSLNSSVISLRLPLSTKIDSTDTLVLMGVLEYGTEANSVPVKAKFVANSADVNIYKIDGTQFTDDDTAILYLSGTIPTVPL